MRHLLIVLFISAFTSKSISQTTAITQQHSRYVDSIHHLLLGTWYSMFVTNDTSSVLNISWDTIYARGHQPTVMVVGNSVRDSDIKYSSSYHYYLQYDSGGAGSLTHCLYHTVIPLGPGNGIDTLLDAIYLIDSNQLQFATDYKEFLFKRKK